MAENLSHVVPDLNAILSFWMRIVSVWYAKVKFGHSAGNYQTWIMILNFDSSDRMWAVIKKGVAGDMAQGSGNSMRLASASYCHDLTKNEHVCTLTPIK